MFKMLVAICQKESAKINGNTFEIVIESLLTEGRWKVCVCMYVCMYINLYIGIHAHCSRSPYS